MVTKESRTVTPTEECDRSEYYIKENVTSRRVARKNEYLNDQVRRLGTNRVGPVVTEDAPADGTGVGTIWKYRDPESQVCSWNWPRRPETL